MYRVLSVFNSLLKSEITHNSHVKRISYNEVTDEVIVIAETGAYVNDEYILQDVSRRSMNRKSSMLQLISSCCQMILETDIVGPCTDVVD